MRLPVPRLSSISLLGIFVAGLLTSHCAFANTPSAQTFFIYDEAGHVIGEYDSNGNPIQEHIYLGDRPVAVAVTSNNTTTIDYVQVDQVNAPRVITDQSQTVLWSWNSDPFGNGQPTGSLTYNLRFPGQYYDAETGHNYNYYRDYAPETGRYIESDPSGLDGGFNTYLYVDAAPLETVDRFGLCPAAIDSGLFSRGGPSFVGGLPGHCHRSQTEWRFFGPLVSETSCGCDGTIECKYALRIQTHDRIQLADCKKRIGIGAWSDYDPIGVTGPSREFTFVIDCKTQNIKAIKTGNITTNIGP